MSASMKSTAFGGALGNNLRPYMSTVPRTRRSAVGVQASKTAGLTEKVVATTTGLTVASFALPQLASAAQEVLVLAEGEPLIVQAGWAALAASFTMSIALVVWGRSGL